MFRSFGVSPQAWDLRLKSDLRRSSTDPDPASESRTDFGLSSQSPSGKALEGLVRAKQI